MKTSYEELTKKTSNTHKSKSMNITFKNSLAMDFESNELLTQWLKGNIELLSEQQESWLRENRKPIIESLNQIFSKEIPLLIKEKKCLDPETLFWGLKLAGFLEAKEVFEWTRRLCHLSTHDLENVLGDLFVTEELPHLLTATLNNWTLLKEFIEDSKPDEFIKVACFDALVFSVANQRIDRLEVISYFKNLFQQIIRGEINDDPLCSLLVLSCVDLWPGECLEEIRESFGLNLVNEFHIDIDFVLETFSRSKDSCIRDLQKKMQQYSFNKKMLGLSDEIHFEKLNLLSQSLKKSGDSTNRVMKELTKGSLRNELCLCGSGKKYKKCCLNKPTQKIPSNTVFETSVISYEPLEESAEMKAVPEEVKESFLDLYYLVNRNPEEAIKQSLEYIPKYPKIPMLYNFLYGAYQVNGEMREAVKVLKETLLLFPDYLFARLEYSLYLLRRGEPDKARDLLGNAGTLSQLYPERKIFHAVEWLGFAYATGLYWIQKNEINQAKIYLSILEKIDSKANQTADLKQKIRKKIFLSMHEKSTHMQIKH